MKYSSAESSALIDALSNNIEIANEITERLSNGCAYLVSSLDSGKLQGAAYTAFYRYYYPCNYENQGSSG